jgi:radical SAM protein with 4Fe4S-binding SPASM domain
MLYEGVLEVIEAATSLGLPTAIASNGTRVAESADCLVRAPLYLLQISIDGHNAALHNRLRPAAGAGDNFQAIQVALDTVTDARRAYHADLPLIVSLTVVSRANAHHLVDIYEAFRTKVDVFVFYLSWWIDDERAKAHGEDFSRRFGFAPTKHRGWLGNWRSNDFEMIAQQFGELLTRSRTWGAPPVTIIPMLMEANGLREYYTNHSATFGHDACVSIYQAVEINSNGDVSPCRDYNDYVVGNIRNATVTELWNSPAYRNFRRSLAAEGLMPVCSRCCGLMGY